MKSDAEIIAEILEDMEFAKKTPDNTWSREEIERWFTVKITLELRRAIYYEAFMGTPYISKGNLFQ